MAAGSEQIFDVISHLFAIPEFVVQFHGFILSVFVGICFMSLYALISATEAVYRACMATIQSPSSSVKQQPFNKFDPIDMMAVGLESGGLYCSIDTICQVLSGELIYRAFLHEPIFLMVGAATAAAYCWNKLIPTMMNLFKP